MFQNKTDALPVRENRQSVGFLYLIRTRGGQSGTALIAGLGGSSFGTSA